MTREFIIDPEAEADLVRAKNWYDDRRNGLGAEFVEKVEHAFEVIRRMPTTPRLVFKDLRRVLTRRFPYSIIYRVSERRITIVAVYHTSRDPLGWKDRT